jgi:hypothetical protein
MLRLRHISEDEARIQKAFDGFERWMTERESEPGGRHIGTRSKEEAK